MRDRLPFLLIALLAGLISLAPTPAAADSGQLAWERDTVYIVDHTSSRWPVRSVAEQVDNGSPLNFVVRRSCPSGAQCFRVYEGTLPGNKLGVATVRRYGSTIVGAQVILDASWQGTRQKRRAVICHELGHAVGLTYHSHSRSSCLTSGISSRTSTTLSRGDKAALNARY